jgi:hypothetical protein
MTLNETLNHIIQHLPNDMLMNSIFPFDTKTPKEDRRKPHMKETIYNNKPFVISPDMTYFEFGNENAERITPHYHILEDAKIIRMPYRGTKKSKGSQRFIGRKSDRDYGAVSYRETTKGIQLIQEYRQNMTRNYDGRIGAKTQPREYSKRKQVSNINKRNYRYNIHYQYIERILAQVAPQIAVSIDAKLKLGESSLLDNNTLSGFLNDNYELETIALEETE